MTLPARRQVHEPAGLRLTGERTLPGIWHENYWFRRHEAAYRWVARDLDVSGTFWKQVSARGTAAGCSPTPAPRPCWASTSTSRACSMWVAITERCCRCAPTWCIFPVRDGVVDLVVSAQTVEHLWDQEGFLRECARVLRPGGRLVLTTPNRATFPPGNPFHSRELDAGELAGLLPSSLRLVSLLGLHHGDRLSDADRRVGGLVAAQLRETHGEWDDELRATVAATTARDFAVGPVARCLDLLLVATRRRA